MPTAFTQRPTRIRVDLDAMPDEVAAAAAAIPCEVLVRPNERIRRGYAAARAAAG